jgi:hypothetical protein
MASDMTDMARTSQTQLLSAMGAVQETMLEGYSKVAGTVGKLVPAKVTSFIPDMPYLPKPAEAIELSFGFAEKVLASQKSFAQKLFAATPEVAPKVTPAAKK